MKSAFLLAAFAGAAVAGDNVEPTGKFLPEWRQLASSTDDIKSMGYVYQVGDERVILTTKPAASRAGEVEVYQYNEPLFDTRGNGACPDAINLFGQLFPDAPDGTPTYEAWEGTAQFEANTTVDTLAFTASAIDEDPATQNDSVTDNVEFNDFFLIVEENETAVDVLDTPTLNRWGVAVLDLAGDDNPPAPGVSVFLYTIDLTLSDLEFELGDDDGMANETCVNDTGAFNANSFLDVGTQLLIQPDDTDSLHDASFTMFFLQPDGAGGQIDPQNAADRALITPQGMLQGFSDAWVVVDPLDQANTFPAINAIPAGSGRGSLDLIRIWDLTVPPFILGPDFTADPFGPEWLDENGAANLGGGFRIAPTTRAPLFDANPFIEADYDLSPFDILCETQIITSLDGTQSVEVPAKGGSEPYVGFFGPTPGTCGDMGPMPCSPADLAEPFGVIDLSDADAFIAAFLAGDPVAAGFAPPLDIADLSDVDVFIPLFLAGCPSP